MHTGLNEEQILIQDMAHRFAQENVAPHSGQWD